MLRLLVGLLAVACLLAVTAAVRNIVARGDGTYTDTILLSAALRMRDGLPLYPDVMKPPFLFLHYGPLYPLMTGAIANLADLGTFETLVLSRVLTFVATLITAASVVGLSALCGARRVGAVVAGALFLTTYVIHPWAYVARTDLAAAAFVFGGLYVLLRWPSVAGAVVSGLLMAAGFECKQTYAIGVVAVTLSLAWQRQWTRAIALSGAWAAFAGGTILLMAMLGESRFMEQTIGNNVIPFRPATVIRQLAFYVPQSATLLLLAAVGALGSSRQTPVLLTVRVYLVFATLTGLVAVARMGSNYNYLLEATALLAVFGGVGFGRLWSVVEAFKAGGRPTGRLGTILATSVTAIALCMFSLPTLTMWIAAANPPDKSALIDAIREQPGPVITEQDSLAVMLAGKEPIGGDPIGVASISLTGRWDPAPLHELIRTQAFSLVVLNTPIPMEPIYDGFSWWPAGTLELVNQHYALERRLGGYYLYVPRR